MLSILHENRLDFNTYPIFYIESYTINIHTGLGSFITGLSRDINIVYEIKYYSQIQIFDYVGYKTLNHVISISTLYSSTSAALMMSL